MHKDYENTITLGDCSQHLRHIEAHSIDLFLSDIPYGISHADWDVLHANSNSALLGSSPAQRGKSGFKRRGKPINGWSSADKKIGSEYQQWCKSWVEPLYPCMKRGSFAFVFGSRRTIHHAINAFEECGFLLKDILAWKKSLAHHRAQRVCQVLEKRGMSELAKQWRGWRLGNLAPIWEPIAFFMKPYRVGGTITDNLLENGVGALNVSLSDNGTNMLDYGFAKHEKRMHEAQKPERLIEHLILLATREEHVVLDAFMGCGTTAVVARRLGRKFIGFEVNADYHALCMQRLAANASRLAC